MSKELIVDEFGNKNKETPIINIYEEGMEKRREEDAIAAKKATEDKAQALEELKEEFNVCINAFAKDRSYFKNYDRYEPLGQEVLVRLFTFKPREDVIKRNPLFGEHDIWITSPLNQQPIKQSQAILDKMYPIVMIIKLGKTCDPAKALVEGDLYTIPYDDVVGNSFNPEFLDAMNTYARQGGKSSLAHLPSDIPQKISNIHKHWERYQFSMPDRFDNPTEDDKLTYLIPDLKIKAKFRP